MSSANVFSSAVSTSVPPSMFAEHSHPVAIPDGVSGVKKGTLGPVPTNNFMFNMLLGEQTNPVYLDPYSVWYSNSDKVGLAISHQTAAQKEYASGPAPVQYYYNATGVKSLILGSSDFSTSTKLELDTLTNFSANINFTNSITEYLLIPVVQGQGFITGIYYNLIPRISTEVGIISVTGVAPPRSNISKFKIVLNNGYTWSMYVTIPSDQSIEFGKSGSYDIIASNSVSGCVIQLCFGNDAVYDSAAGCYPTGCSLSGTTSGSSGSYKLLWSTLGVSNSGTPLLYALPHHVKSFTSSMSSAKTNLTLDSLVSGTCTGYLTCSFNMTVSTPSEITFEPFSTISGAKSSYTSAALAAIKAAAEVEAAEDVATYSNVDSMYTAGKILDKYAYVLYVCHTILKDSTLTSALLTKLKTAIERFSQNKQTYPLNFDTTWKGIVSSAGLSGDSSKDYGNTYYNDHHFHYGYHIHAAAIVAKVDTELGGTWLATNKSWVQTLIRDVANPSTSDSHFPVSRSFDWYNGHSWAKGLLEAADGKDEESSSEDYNFAYAMKIWAKVISDANMEARADIMLGVMKQSMNDYMLYKDDNEVEPSQFIGNKVSGIKFQNKIDHATWFGLNEEYIQGIHMLPITPISSFIRSPGFVEEEWEQKLSPIIANVTGGWKGILMLNVGLYDPKTAYSFFSSSSFQTSYLDNGMSRTWSLAYLAGVGGAS